MEVENFSDLEQKFREITDRIVWCTVTTVDRQGRPRRNRWVTTPLRSGRAGPPMKASACSN